MKISQSDEILDIVNEDNEVIGKNTKARCHSLGLIHRNVHIFIFNYQNELLLQTRKRSGPYSRMLTSSASGHVKSGESYEQAAYRETMEEIGIRVLLTFVTGFKVFSDYEKQFGHLFIGKSNNGFELDKDEVVSVRFYKMSEIDSMIKSKKFVFSPNFLECYKLYKNIKNYKSG